MRLSDDGLDGLLHISQISQGFVKDVSAILTIGQETLTRSRTQPQPQPQPEPEPEPEPEPQPEPQP